MEVNKSLSKKRGRTPQLPLSKNSAFIANQVETTSESESETNEPLNKRIKDLENKLGLLDEINVLDIVNKVNILITQQINNYQLFIREKEQAEITLGSIIHRIESLETKMLLNNESQKKINDNFDYRINALQVSSISSSNQSSSSNLVIQSQQRNNCLYFIEKQINNLTNSSIETARIINEINKNVSEIRKMFLE